MLSGWSSSRHAPPIPFGFLWSGTISLCSSYSSWQIGQIPRCSTILRFPSFRTTAATLILGIHADVRIFDTLNAGPDLSLLRNGFSPATTRQIDGWGQLGWHEVSSTFLLRSLTLARIAVTIYKNMLYNAPLERVNVYILTCFVANSSG